MTETTAEQNPPILQGPTDKEKKYDRQLRLWAANGQQALEDAHILLLNSGSGTVGIETLKNLVLPGIGKFTIADDAVVTEADLGVNFFLDEGSLGKQRSQCCAELLQELNPDVEGDWYPRGTHLFNDEAKYTLVVYTLPIAPQALARVEAYTQKYKVPLFSINSAGFYSYFHLDLPGAFPIVDTHPDSTSTTDLRLLSPWPELSTFARDLTANIHQLDAHEHGHTPYLVLLLYYLEEWKKAHEGQPPKSYAEKIAFRKTLSAEARTDNPEGGEENYEEAVAAVLKNISEPALSSSVRDVFEYAPEPAEAVSSFWVITNAVKLFYAKHKALPLSGSVPDMKAQSSTYVKLQGLYKKKAREDVAEVFESVRSHPQGSEITSEEVEAYCKNAAFIKLIRGSVSEPETLKALAGAELNVEFALTPTLIPVYLALRASEHSITDSLEEDELCDNVSQLVPDVATDERVIQAIREVARANRGELHNISALTGGMVAQEIIKIITKQYVPIDNTCVFDGITSRTQIFKI
ncbi:MAG: hypothetical protein M1818_001151 [Claussenomyces sp. TS43310]|nr:MAG: hypothetical protein M1818_001151 [Claussenomyces sp. TS43310]